MHKWKYVIVILTVVGIIASLSAYLLIPRKVKEEQGVLREENVGGKYGCKVAITYVDPWKIE